MSLDGLNSKKAKHSENVIQCKHSQSLTRETHVAMLNFSSSIQAQNCETYHPHHLFKMKGTLKKHKNLVNHVMIFHLNLIFSFWPFPTIITVKMTLIRQFAVTLKTLAAQHQIDVSSRCAAVPAVVENLLSFTPPDCGHSNLAIFVTRCFD